MYSQSTALPYSQSLASQRNKLAFDSRFIRRNKFISKRRYILYKQPITKRKFGKSIIAKLAYVASAEITSVVDWVNVYGLVSLMQSSGDWANFRDSYALFNILNVTVKVYPIIYTYTAGITRVAGLCYDIKDNTAIASIGSIADHSQHLLMNFMSPVPVQVFTCKAKSLGSVPQSTGVNTETWGWIKAYGDKDDFGNNNITIAKLEFIITVAFSQEQ